MLAVEIIIWVIAIVYGVITIYRLRKTKKEYEEAQREEVDAMAEALRTTELPKNDFGIGTDLTQNITINSSFTGVTREEEIMGAFNQFGDQAFQLSGVAKR